MRVFGRDRSFENDTVRGWSIGTLIAIGAAGPLSLIVYDIAPRLALYSVGLGALVGALIRVGIAPLSVAAILLCVFGLDRLLDRAPASEASWLHIALLTLSGICDSLLVPNAWNWLKRLSSRVNSSVER